MRLINAICFFLPLVATTQVVEDTKNKKDLFVCYGRINPEQIEGYSMVILESQHYNASEIKVFKTNNKKVLGYLSLTEVNEYTFFYQDIKPFTKGVNENWNSNFINLETEEARQILSNAAAQLMKKGFDGLFLDNLDNVSQWGSMPDQKMKLLRLLEQLKNENENIFLMQNSGLFLTKELRNITDAILIESVFTSYDFNAKQYAINTNEDKNRKLELLNEIRNKPVFILEYVADEKRRIEIQKELDQLDHPYFIANIDLKGLPEFKINEK